MNLDNGKGIQLAASTSWTKAAWIAVAATALYVAVTIVGTAALVAAAGAAGIALSATAVIEIAAASGCLGGAASAALIDNLQDAHVAWSERLIDQVAGCLLGVQGAVLGPFGRAGILVGQALRTAFGAAPAAVVGTAAVGRGAQLGLRMTGIVAVTRATADAAG